MKTPADQPEEPGEGAFSWFLRGMRGIISLPAFILSISFVGFTGFASESGVSATEAVFMTGAIWAMPAMVLLVTSIMSGASLATAFLTVTLSSIRFMPMVATLVPEIRTPRTRIWVLLLVSHFIAVTAWVFTMERIGKVPPEHRISFFTGFGLTLTSMNMILVAVLYPVVEALPPLVAGTLFFLTPIYFVTSIWASSRDSAGHVAMIVGLAFAPVFHGIAPDFDILYTGVVGGTVAFFIDRAMSRRRLAAGGEGAGDR